jgi:hypothetical protein
MHDEKKKMAAGGRFERPISGFWERTAGESGAHVE